VGLWVLYAAVPYNDTPSYWRLAEAVRHGFARYDGTRTPGYPLFLALTGTEQRAWLVQMGMGVAITLLFFIIGWQLSGKASLGGLAALAHTLNFQQVFFEANLLSETATTFWVVLALAGTVTWLCRPARRSPWLAAGLGLVTSLAWLTRPLFLYLPFWVLFFMALAAGFPWIGSKEVEKTSYLKALLPLFAFCVPVVMVLGAWLGFIHDRYHQWALTTMTGYHMVQHTGEFFEYVPDEYAALRDTYLKYRDARRIQYGTQANTIWDAIPEMQKVSGKSFYSLSQLLAQISTRLIRDHPDLYLKNVIEGWWWFWRAPVYWAPESFAWQAAVPAMRGLFLLQRFVLFGCNLFFLATSGLAAAWPRARRAWKLDPGLWHVAGSIWFASILQTLVDHGDNVRFLVPLQSQVVLWVLWIVYVFIKSRSS
jgi:hypothetical protein